MIHFRELPMEYEHNFRKQIWSLRNLGKSLLNSEEARRQMKRTGRERIGRTEETFARD